MMDNGVVSFIAHEKSTINTDNAFVEFPVIKYVKAVAIKLYGTIESASFSALL